MSTPTIEDNAERILLEMQQEKDLEPLVSPDARVIKMQSKIDILADLLSCSTLLVKKCQAGPSKDHAAIQPYCGPLSRQQ